MALPGSGALGALFPLKTFSSVLRVLRPRQCPSRFFQLRGSFR